MSQFLTVCASLYCDSKLCCQKDEMVRRIISQLVFITKFKVH